MDFEQLKADVESQPIYGYVPSAGYTVSIPLISHITDNLYVGGHSSKANLGDFFSHVFSLYAFEPPYVTHESVKHAEVVMFDSPTEDTSKVEQMVDDIVAALEEGGNVLVHCQAGINRSNLTAALVLRKWKGLTSREAIDMLREKRHSVVLANRGFENYLLGLDKD